MYKRALFQALLLLAGFAAGYHFCRLTHPTIQIELIAAPRPTSRVDDDEPAPPPTPAPPIQPITKDSCRWLNQCQKTA